MLRHQLTDILLTDNQWDVQTSTDRHSMRCQLTNTQRTDVNWQTFNVQTLTDRQSLYRRQLTDIQCTDVNWHSMRCTGVNWQILNVQTSTDRHSMRYTDVNWQILNEMFRHQLTDTQRTDVNAQTLNEICAGFDPISGTDRGKQEQKTNKHKNSNNRCLLFLSFLI